MSDRFRRIPKQTSTIFPISEFDREICKNYPQSNWASGVRFRLAKIRFCREFYKANKGLIGWIKGIL